MGGGQKRAIRVKCDQNLLYSHVKMLQYNPLFKNLISFKIRYSIKAFCLSIGQKEDYEEIITIINNVDIITIVVCVQMNIVLMENTQNCVFICNVDQCILKNISMAPMFVRIYNKTYCTPHNLFFR